MIIVILSIFFPASFQSQTAQQLQAAGNVNLEAAKLTEGNISGASVPQFKSFIYISVFSLIDMN